jgi:hypothetical protein
MDYNSELDQVVVNSVQGELYVIDHGSTFTPGDPQASIAKAAGPAGDSLYRFGDPARYAQGDPPRVLENWDNATSGHKQMGGALDVQWINPFLDANGRDTGKYVNSPDAGYRREEYDRDTHNSPRQISRQVAWSYRSINNHGFFSQIGCSGQRLPNGNTLVCSAIQPGFCHIRRAIGNGDGDVGQHFNQLEAQSAHHPEPTNSGGAR